MSSSSTKKRNRRTDNSNRHRGGVDDDNDNALTENDNNNNDVEQHDDDLSEEGLLFDENFRDPEPEEFDLEFEFFDAQEDDFHGIKAFLNGYVDPAEFLDTSDIAGVLHAQYCVFCPSSLSSSESDDY
jgi:hypothetical protein